MAGLTRAQEDLSLQITSYYLTLLFQKEIVRTYQNQLDLTRKQVERTTVLVDTGSVPRSQLLDIEAQAASDETNLVTAQNDMNQAKLNLAHVLGITDIRTFDIEEPDTDKYNIDNESLNADYLYDMDIEQRPRIVEAGLRLESSRYAFKSARANRYPTLSLGVGYSSYYYYNFSAAFDNRSFSRQLRTQGNQSIGLNLSVPIFNGFGIRNGIRAARNNIMRAELALESARLAERKEINQAAESASAALAKYRSSAKALTAASEAYDYATERYSVGRATVFELSEAQTKLTSAQSSLLQAKYEYIFRKQVLERYGR
jgi:outer membrane protein